MLSGSPTQEVFWFLKWALEVGVGFMGERSLGLWIQQNSQNWPWSHLHVPQRPPRHLQGSTAVRVGTYACVNLVHSREAIPESEAPALLSCATGPPLWGPVV